MEAALACAGPSRAAGLLLAPEQGWSSVLAALGLTHLPELRQAPAPLWVVLLKSMSGLSLAQAAQLAAEDAPPGLAGGL